MHLCRAKLQWSRANSRGRRKRLPVSAEPISAVNGAKRTAHGAPLGAAAHNARLLFHAVHLQDGAGGEEELRGRDRPEATRAAEVCREAPGKKTARMTPRRAQAFIATVCRKKPNLFGHTHLLVTWQVDKHPLTTSPTSYQDRLASTADPGSCPVGILSGFRV